jgi:hypothetical protein
MAVRVRVRNSWVLVFALFGARSAGGAPGTHAPAISTWDTRASSVEFGFRPGFLSGGHFDVLSYNANFTATNGKLSSQFGLHYSNVRTGAEQRVLQGLGATAVAVFSNPIGDRYENGTPRSALGVYVGAAPTALVNGQSAFVSLPLVLGLGVPWAPSESVTITPWIEGSPGVNLDTQIRTTTVDLTGVDATVSGTSVTLSDAAVSKILDRSVSFRTSVTFGLRAGLDLGLKLGESVDLDISGAVGSLGGALQGTLVGWLGGGLVFRWDKVVPAVLSPERRLRNEDCTDVEERHRACELIRGSESTPPGSYGQPAPASGPYYPTAPPYSAPPAYSGRPAPAPYPTPPAYSPPSAPPPLPAPPAPSAYPTYRAPPVAPPPGPRPAPANPPSAPNIPTRSFPP